MALWLFGIVCEAGCLRYPNLVMFRLLYGPPCPSQVALQCAHMPVCTAAKVVMHMQGLQKLLLRASDALAAGEQGTAGAHACLAFSWVHPHVMRNVLSQQDKGVAPSASNI